MRKNRFLPILLLLVLLLFLSACGSPKSDGILRILTYKTSGADDLAYQLKNAVAYLEETYPELQVEIEYLAVDGGQEAELRLQQLRTEILAGNGPDVYLFPSADPYRPGLFLDVNQALGNGHFLDISKLYDADTELNTAALQPQVMEAGVWKNKRYILPLRYDLSVYFVNTARLPELGKDLDWLAQTNVQALMDAAIAENNPLLAKCAFPKLAYYGDLLAYFPDSIDYQRDNVTLSLDALTDFWAGVNGLARMTEDDATYPDTNNVYSTGVSRYVRDNEYIGNFDEPFIETTLDDAIGNALVCEANGIDYEMLPVRGVDGSVTAWVTLWGAVGSSCGEPEIAYDFLRLFLTEEYQWELERPGYASEASGMFASGWPVRTQGSEDHVYKSYYRYYRYEVKKEKPSLNEDQLERSAKILATTLTREDHAFLDFEIDHVYFDTALECEFFRDYYPATSTLSPGCPSLMDPAEMAEDTLSRIAYSIAEG